MTMKDKLYFKCKPVLDWIDDNKETLIVLAPIIAIVLGKTITAVRVHSNNIADIKMKENYIYDRSLGYSLKLKRRLNGKQLSLIQARKEAGESLVDILASMRVLK